jgi:leucyl-tRNA synthetase
MEKYDHKRIEKKWQEKWQKSGIFEMKKDSSDAKYYCLVEFPFPSGDGMHTGHFRSYTAMDIIARKRRAEGFNVLYPIGWDAFGLPTENYAIKTGVQPAVATKKNTDTFRKQLKEAGFSFDWSREINTTDPKYYKWTQWIFLQLYKHDLAYKAKTLINWCPKDKIGLANEEVIQGKCERCGTVVEKREKEQWMLAITKYAERLAKDLDDVDYPERVKIQQRNWIGQSEGAELSFDLLFSKNPKDNEKKEQDGKKAHIDIFTTRPDTLFGATYLVLAPEHAWLTLAIDNNHDVLLNKDEVKAYIEHALKRLDIDRTAESREKTGIELKGVKAINPVSGEEIPVFVADYVLGGYGTGAIMAVPAHDRRDMQFAKKYNVPIREVVVPNIVDKRNPPIEEKKSVERKNIHAIVRDPKTGKYLALKWKKFDWVTFPMGGQEEGETVEEACRREVREETGFINLELKELLQGTVRAEYFAAHKDQNRVSYTNAAVFDLINDEKTEIAEEEKGNHDIIWLGESELNYEHMTHAEVGRWQEMLKDKEYVFEDDGFLINSGKFSGMQSEEARKAITEAARGKMVTTFKLRDWVFSRQRYWGEPIPIIHCMKCGEVAVPEDQLPVVLPEVENYQPTDDGESPLAAISEWVNVKCPKCGGGAKRETDTMPNWAGSSWYFFRYLDPTNDQAFAGKEILKQWMPVDWYNGGMEHTTLHLLYSRFWNKFLFDIGQAPTSEPYAKRTSHGLILADGGEKMSKSKGNVVNPDQIVETFGADTLRLYEMFMGPFEQAVAWSMDGIVGPRRFIERVWKLAERISKNDAFLVVTDGDHQKLTEKETLAMSETPPTSDPKLISAVNKGIVKISSDIEEMKFNTAVSGLMMLSNEFEKAEVIGSAEWESFLKLLAPFAPHVSEELWHMIGHQQSIQLESWPKAVEVLGKDNENVTIVVQINGKNRDSFKVEQNQTADEEMIKETSIQREIIKKWLANKEIKRIIYVPGRLVNIVV